MRQCLSNAKLVTTLLVVKTSLETSLVHITENSWGRSGFRVYLINNSVQSFFFFPCLLFSSLTFVMLAPFSDWLFLCNYKTSVETETRHFSRFKFRGKEWKWFSLIVLAKIVHLLGGTPPCFSHPPYIMLGMPRYKALTILSLGYFSRLCLQQAISSDQVISLSRRERKLCYCFLSSGDFPKISVTQLCHKPTAAQHSSGLILHHLHENQGQKELMQVMLLTGCTMSNKVLCLWPRNFVSSASIYKTVTD